MPRDSRSKADWHRVADLSRNLDFGSAPDERLRKVLQLRGFEVRDDAIDTPPRVRPVPLRVKILTLLRFEELRPDG